MLDKIVFRKELETGFEIASKNFDKRVGGVSGIFYQTGLELAFLPYKAYITLIAITKTIYRMLVSKENLLEWLTAEQAEKQAITTKREYYRQMILNVVLGFIILFFSMQGNMFQRILGAFISALWLTGPAIASGISKPREKENNLGKIKEEERKHLLEIARKTWNYFSCHADQQNNFLPPDNYEEARNQKIASRTSPTNIGLELISIISAVDFKFITKKEGVDMAYKCLNTVENLVKWHGHLYNWYNTETLEPLTPKYISSVDSGNFLCYLYVLKQFLLEIQEEDLKEKTQYLIKLIDNMMNNADFSKLYDPKKKLFSIGYSIEENKLTDSYYDLLSSEARQTSLLAIAKKDVPVKHWSALSRTLTIFNKYKGLVSWSGTSFEYLMANMIIRNYPGSILQESCKFMVFCQREYCKVIGIPWGISEAAFSLKDLYGNYQYKAFGIPWLGLKRGLADERVVSSYGSILALVDYPREVMDNIKVLEKEKMQGEYGLYESIDYTPSRLKVGSRNEVVKTFMAHHQGLILGAINNFFHDNILVSRFMKNPEIEAIDILLQERMPKIAILTKEKKERIEKIHLEDYETYSQREYTKPSDYFKRVNVISSDNYSICLDENGEGYSKYKGLLINKYKEDSGEEQGIFFYIKNIKNKKIWTSGRLKKSASPDKYKITFSPDSSVISRVDGDIETKTKITIAPEGAAEIRELELKNMGLTEEVMEVSSIIEPVLCKDKQDYAHPAFNNLFLSYEWSPETQTMIVRRKKHGTNEQEMYMGVSMYAEQDETNDLEYETDKTECIGRNNIGIPEKILKSKPFSNKTKLVPESLVALRHTIKIKPNETAKITLIIVVSQTSEIVLQRIKEYRNIEKIERTFELSRAKNEAENRYLGVQAEDTDLYQKMLGFLTFQNPLMSMTLYKLPKDIYPKDDLWSLGISGDLPILLVKIKDPNDSYVISNILKAKEFFNLKNCEIDIVILNEEKNVYEQYVKEKIENAILERHLAYLLGQTNGIFIVNNNDLSPRQRNTLVFRSNLCLDAGRGKLKEQIEELEESYIDQKEEIGFEKKVSAVETSKSQINLDYKNLKYYNEYGGFSENGDEYVMKVSSDSATPTVWSHVLANKNFGTIITESLGGYTWSKNSRLNRLSSWNNIPYLDVPSEILYIKEKQTGKIWSNSSFVSGKEGDFKIQYGFGYGVYTNLCNDFFTETKVFVPKEDSAKITLVKIKNTRADSRNLKLVYYVKPVLGEDEDITKGQLDLKQKNNNCLEMRNLGNESFSGITFVGTSENILSYTGDKKEFIGNGSILNPDGINRTSLSGENSLGKLGCIAFETELNLNGYESKELSIFFGEAENEEELNKLENKYKDVQNCNIELGTVKNYWFEKLNRIQVKTPVESMNIMLNGWSLYQTTCSRLFARSGYYQSGGAYGFRDQLQDILAFKYIDDKALKEQILRACMHQFEEGDVEHWWHDETSRGIRTRFSDDMLWLPFVVAEYIKVASDFSILDDQAEYLNGEELPEGIDERYDMYTSNGNKASVYDHCIKAINRAISLGENGLPKIGSGDWNDGFSTVGNKGRGESVWLGFFLYDILNKFIPICEKKEDREKAQYYSVIRDNLRKSLNTKGWDGRWFRRAFTDNGDILGSNENEECKIDSISQSWAVISEAGDNDKKYIAMEALENYLIDRENGIIKLLTPPFEKSILEPGYIKSYLPGVRENGGQYTHAAAWAICSYAKLGLGEKATEYFRMINPIEHAKTRDEANKYKVEPYVFPGDVYGQGEFTGRGGWTWYTGSSSWMYQAGIEWILGLKIQNGELALEPNISAEWKEYSIRYRYKDSIYNIKVRNPNGKTSGVSKFTVNGKAIPEKKILIDGNVGNYEIEIEM